MKAILGTTVLSLVLGLAVGVLVSRQYWGYSFQTPTTPQALESATRVRFVTPLEAAGAGAECTLQVDQKYSVPDRVRYATEDPYYAHEGRLSCRLIARGIDPLRALPDAHLRPAEIQQQLRMAKALVSGDAGYPDATCLRGAAVEVEDAQGGVALVVGLRGRQLSNDHYPYYEATLYRSVDGWRLERVQRFFYDVAGMEGAEWPRLHGFFAILAFATAAAIALTYSAGRRAGWWRGAP